MSRVLLIGLVLLAAVFVPVFVASPASAAPALTVVSPPDQSQVSTLGFRIVVTATGITLDPDNVGNVSVPGRGHIHYYEIVAGSLTLLAASASTVFDTSAFAVGTHHIRVEVTNNDHSPLTPPVRQDFNVTAVPPSLEILEPAEGARVSTLGFRAAVQVGGLELDADSVGLAKVPGRGHIHFYEVVGQQLTLLAATASTVVDTATLSAGPHRIRIELANNDHSPLTSPVFREVNVTAGPPEIRVLDPIDGARVSSLGFRVVVQIANLSINRENYGGPNVPGQGHYHVMRVGAGGAETLLAAPLADAVVITGQSAGSLELNISLRNNNHSPLAQPSFVRLTVTVTAPSIQASAPASIEEGKDLVVTFSVAGLAVDPSAFGGGAEPGRGHVHVFVDGTYRTATPGDSAVITGLTRGAHTIKVQLFNNDHSPITPEVSREVTVQVTAPAAPPSGGISSEVFFGSVGFLVLLLIILGILFARKGRGGAKTQGGT